MKPPKALLAREIIIDSVMPPKELKNLEGILERPYYLSFSWKSGKRKGALCEAIINEKISGIADKEIGQSPLPDFLDYVRKRFKKIHSIEYEIVYRQQRKPLRAKKMIGECEKHKSNVVPKTATHKTNRTIMTDKKQSALSYPDATYVSDEKLKIC